MEEKYLTALLLQNSAAVNSVHNVPHAASLIRDDLIKGLLLEMSMAKPTGTLLVTAVAMVAHL